MTKATVGKNEAGEVVHIVATFGDEDLPTMERRLRALNRIGAGKDEPITYSIVDAVYDPDNYIGDGAGHVLHVALPGQTLSKKL